MEADVLKISSSPAGFVSAAMQLYALERFEKPRLFLGETLVVSARLHFSKDGDLQTVTCGITMHCKSILVEETVAAHGDTMYRAIDRLMSKLVDQILSYKGMVNTAAKKVVGISNLFMLGDISFQDDHPETSFGVFHSDEPGGHGRLMTV